MNRNMALRLVLVLVGLAHLALGLIANLAPPDTLVRVGSGFYGASIELTPQVHHLTRIVGAFMIGVSVMAFLASLNPQRNKAVILGIVVVLLLRVAQRVVLASEITTAFGIASARIWIQAAFFLLTAIALIVLWPRSPGRSTTAGG